MKKRGKILAVVGIVVLIVLLIVFRKVVIFTVMTLLFSPGIEPLSFAIYNNDTNSHQITMEIFNSNNRSLFQQTYKINPKERIHSPEITKDKGEYIFKITLDGEIERTFKARVGLGFSQVGILLYYTRYRGNITPVDIKQPVT
jgi:hypothetical protein